VLVGIYLFIYWAFKILERNWR